jgi:hypothetical protein
MAKMMENKEENGYDHTLPMLMKQQGRMIAMAKGAY